MLTFSAQTKVLQLSVAVQSGHDCLGHDLHLTAVDPGMKVEGHVAQNRFHGK